MPATPRRRRLAGAGMLLLVVGCGQEPAESGSPFVDIVDNDFDPGRIAVGAGETVQWTNTGAATHTVTFTDGGPDSGPIMSDATFSTTFAEAGEFTYRCGLHPRMAGSVVVTE